MGTSSLGGKVGLEGLLTAVVNLGGGSCLEGGHCGWGWIDSSPGYPSLPDSFCGLLSVMCMDVLLACWSARCVCTVPVEARKGV